MRPSLLYWLPFARPMRPVWRELHAQKTAATLRAGNTRPYLFVIPCRPQITGRNLLGAVADRAPTCIVSF